MALCCCTIQQTGCKCETSPWRELNGWEKSRAVDLRVLQFQPAEKRLRQVFRVQFLLRHSAEHTSLLRIIYHCCYFIQSLPAFTACRIQVHVVHVPNTQSESEQSVVLEDLCFCFPFLFLSFFFLSFLFLLFLLRWWSDEEEELSELEEVVS